MVESDKTSIKLNRLNYDRGPWVGSVPLWTAALMAAAKHGWIPAATHGGQYGTKTRLGDDLLKVEVVNADDARALADALTRALSEFLTRRSRRCCSGGGFGVASKRSPISARLGNSRSSGGDREKE